MEQDQEIYYYLEAASGHLVRVPASQAGEWVKTQEALKRGDPEVLKKYEKAKKQMEKEILEKHRSYLNRNASETPLDKLLKAREKSGRNNDQ